MKKLFFSILLTSCVVSTFAADFSNASDASRWAGLYAGANAGQIWGQFSGSAEIGPISNGTLTGAPDFLAVNHIANSPMLGGQVGYNWQFNKIVVGVEADYDTMHLRAARAIDATIPLPFAPGPGFGVPAVLSSSTYSSNFYVMKSNWNSALLARLGFVFAHWLVYGAAGPAFTSMTMSGSVTPVPVPGRLPTAASFGSGNKSLFGGTLGAGADYALTNHWDVGVEYRYTTYGAPNFNLGLVQLNGGVLLPGAKRVGSLPHIPYSGPQTAKMSLFTNQITAKINYKFG